jgi:hypothetical protein
VFLTALLLLVSAASAHAQNFSIDWFTIDGGGGTSTGGVYSVSGAIGQPDAGTMSGGSYSLAGGFWGITAIQTPGAPLLTIRFTQANTVIVAWPAPSTGFELEQALNLNTPNWSNVPTPPMTVGAEKQVILPNPLGNRFYRLRKP